jgi:twinkle protein
LTALAAADDREEKDALEAIMSEMGSLVQELGIVLHLVSHLTTPEGKPHEEGGRVTIRHFKGSRSIGFWSFFMFGLERNQQAEDPQEKQTTVFRVLKDRLTGQATGETIAFGYEAKAGKLYEFDGSNQFPSLEDTQQISEF